MRSFISICRAGLATPLNTIAISSTPMRRPMVARSWSAENPRWSAAGSSELGRPGRRGRGFHLGQRGGLVGAFSSRARLYALQAELEPRREFPGISVPPSAEQNQRRRHLDVPPSIGRGIPPLAQERTAIRSLAGEELSHPHPDPRCTDDDRYEDGDEEAKACTGTQH